MNTTWTTNSRRPEQPYIQYIHTYIHIYSTYSDRNAAKSSLAEDKDGGVGHKPENICFVWWQRMKKV